MLTSPRFDLHVFRRYSSQHEFVFHSGYLLRVLLRDAPDCGVNQL
jgi:hypothetical protein